MTTSLQPTFMTRDKLKQMVMVWLPFRWHCVDVSYHHCKIPPNITSIYLTSRKDHSWKMKERMAICVKNFRTFKAKKQRIVEEYGYVTVTSGSTKTNFSKIVEYRDILQEIQTSKCEDSLSKSLWILVQLVPILWLLDLCRPCSLSGMLFLLFFPP